jgi:hypothetical protein
MAQLQSLRDDMPYDSHDLENLAAVLEDYRQGNIMHPGRGKAFFYYAGRKMTGEIVAGKFPLYDHLGLWAQQHGPGKLWLEKVSSSPQDVSNLRSHFSIGNGRARENVRCFDELPTL